MPLHLKGVGAALGPDPHSFAQFDDARVTHVALHLKIDFEQRNLAGYVDLHVRREVRPDRPGSGACNSVRLDVSLDHVVIEKVEQLGLNSSGNRDPKEPSDGKDGSTAGAAPAPAGGALEVPYAAGRETSNFGDSLDISFHKDTPPGMGSSASPEAPLVFRIAYHTKGASATGTGLLASRSSSAVQWLRAEQTLGQQCPLAFSQAQAILARSFVPCQDSPAVKQTLEFSLEVPVLPNLPDCVAICSGELAGIDGVRPGGEMEALSPENVFEKSGNGNGEGQAEVEQAAAAANGHGHVNGHPHRSSLDQNASGSDGSFVSRIFRYRTLTPIPSYLFAFLVGRFEHARIGRMSHVFAEPELLRDAQYELSEVCDEYLSANIQLLSTAATSSPPFQMPYHWGSCYNVAVLPRSFAFGGMENPNCTFMSASLIAGDKSLTTTLAHEIAHSWTGNLVTNKLHRDFWLNEGFTRYVERRVLGVVFGEDHRELQLLVGYKDLVKNVDLLLKNQQGKFTRLDPGDFLTGVDPDEAFSKVPYEKGSLFLLFLEKEVLRSPELMMEWMSHYLRSFAFQSLTTEQFKQHFIEYFSKNSSSCVDEQKKLSIDLGKIDWDHWLYGEGLPHYVFQTSSEGCSPMIDACVQLSKQWLDSTGEGEGDEDDAAAHHAATAGAGCSSGGERFSAPPTDWHARQVMLFLDLLIEVEHAEDFAPSAPAADAALEAVCAVWESNVEIQFRWLMLKLRTLGRPLRGENSRDGSLAEPLVEIEPELLKRLDHFFGHHGRGSYVKPLYLTLKNGGRLSVAQHLFGKHRGFYQDTIANMLAKALEIA
eukprot:g17640.t1